jgi:hypothetical protein
LGIVNANKCIPIFPSLPLAVKVGFSFCPFRAWQKITCSWVII